LDLLRDDVVAEADALVADVHRWPCDELLDLLLGFPAEGAAQVAVRVIVPPSLHFVPLSTRPPGLRVDAYRVFVACEAGSQPRSPPARTRRILDPCPIRRKQAPQVPKARRPRAESVAPTRPSPTDRAATGLEPGLRRGRFRPFRKDLVDEAVLS